LIADAGLRIFFGTFREDCMRVRPNCALLVRGVWQADFFGPDGELVLVAVDRRRRLVANPVVVPHGASRIEAAERLLAILEAADPIAALRIV
jgi:hypothetical protein